MRGLMTRLGLVIIICSVLPFYPHAGAASADTEVRVLSVDFYPSGAKFTFQADVGESFDFTLPGAFDQASVRCLDRKKTTSFKAESSRVKDAADPTELLPLRQKVEEATRAVNLLEGRRAALNQASSMLQAPFAGKTEKLDAGALIEYISNAMKLRTEIENDLVEVGLSASKAQTALHKAQEEYEMLRIELEGKKPFNYSEIIRVSGTAAAPRTLLFEAQTTAAGWNVGYEMDLNSATGDIEATMIANAWQKTGIDTYGKLSFHTRQPYPAVTPPEVRPLTVGLRQPDDIVSLRSYPDAGFNMTKNIPGFAPIATEDTAANYSRVSVAPSVVSTMANVTVNGQGKVGGDGKQTAISLGEFSLKSVPVIISIPQQNKEAWIVASMDSVPVPLLPGAAELAVDGASTGRTTISESVSDMMRMPFGMASRLTSKRERIVSKEGSSLLGRGILNDGYTIEITSAMETEREITVRDRVPVSRTDKVVVEVTRIDPAPSERDEENLLSWRLSVKPGETKKITVEYTIRYPGGETLEYN
ncbi:MAG: DUF4139 domain-containing protein [Synergistaceae bacterium]|jgi:uncharacterized protein (TIGR02231 family)|nr:DUF4139 domain-containing protein [Synergistaceae bacterium]